MLIPTTPADLPPWVIGAAALGLAVRPNKRLIVRLVAAAVILGIGAWIFYQADGRTEPAERPAMEIVIGQWAKEAPLEMRFTGDTAEECRAWQQQFAAKLGQLLGPHEPPAEWQTEVERVVQLPDHERHELILHAQGHPDLPVYLLVPKDKQGPRPGILAIHGHGPAAYDAIAGRTELPKAAAQIERENSDYGLQLVRKGYVVVAPCLMPFGRRLGNRDDFKGDDPCAVAFVRMQLLGRVLMAENLRDCMWSVSLLTSQENVDPERIGCVGLSYGGRMTTLTTALDQRIRVAVVSGALNVMQERVGRRGYSGGCQVIPGLLQYGDVPEIASLIAPRPLLWEVGTEDASLPKDWVEKSLERIKRAYDAFNAADNLHVDRFEGRHVFHGVAAFELLDEVLKP